MELSFEEAYKKLESIVKELENTDIDLETAVNKYKEGLELSKKCFDILKEKEEVVLKQRKELGLEDFKIE